MRTNTVIIEGVPLVFPFDYNPPKRLKDFPTACGAGEFGDKLVPDKPATVSFSPACKAHDKCFELFPPMLSSFILANTIFKQNLFALIEHQETLGWVKAMNYLCADVYLVAVASPIGLSAWCVANSMEPMYNKFCEQLYPEDEEETFE